MYCRVLVFIIVLGLALSSRAELLEKNLGDGLAYFRAELMPQDLPPASVRTGPMVLDLRFARAEEGAAGALDAWLKFRATPNAPVFALINHLTAVELVSVAAAHKSNPGVLSLGEKFGAFTPDIVVPTAGSAERNAYDAMVHGASVESLLRENLGKPRIDEASIMRERAEAASEFPDVDPLELSDTTSKESDASAKTPEPVIDHTLQRAVQLHRSLVALKRVKSVPAK